MKSDTKAQYQILKKLMHDDRVDAVVCATDAGREGELIFRLTYNMAGCRKPMKRLWISSMEESAIRDGFHNLRPGVIMTICTSQHYAGRKQTGLWVSMALGFLRYCMVARH